MDQLLKLIGISRDENASLTALDEAKGYLESSEDLFIDELEGIAELNPEFASFFHTAKLTASRRAVEDLVTNILSRYKPKREPFEGNIGGLKADRPLIIAKDFAGSRIEFSEFVGGNFRLRRITLLLNYTGLVDIRVIKVAPLGGLIQELDPIVGLTAVAKKGVPNELADPIDFPTEWEGYPVHYYFLYATAGGVQPMNNSTSCGCGRKEHIFNSYANYVGVSGNDLEAPESFPGSNIANGIIIDGLFTCNLDGLVLRMTRALPKYKTVLAYAMRYLAGYLIHESILRSPEITFDTMVDRETVQAIRDQYFGEYQTRLLWLAQNTDPSLSDCLSCQDSRMKLVGIRV